MNICTIKPVDDLLKPWMLSVLESQWGSDNMVTRGRIHFYRNLPGFVAMIDGKPLGLATFWIENGECELTSLNSFESERGIGTTLLKAVQEVARHNQCRRIWLITTNDNTHALRFYQRRGYIISAVYLNAIEASRRLKPELPWLGSDDIPLRDEIELELTI